MNVYQLERWPIGSVPSGQVAAMIVAADKAGPARRAASRRCGVEGPGPWLDPEKSTCKLVKIERESVIMRAVQP